MVYFIYPKYDSTIYEDSRYLNTGLDSILEIGKQIISTGSVATTSSVNNSRVLLQFDYSDLNVLTAAGINTSSASYYLQLFTTEIVNSPTTYTLFVHPVSGSWSSGVGKFEYGDKVTDGVNWRYTTGTNDRIEWLTSSFVAGTTGSWISKPGGGNWYVMSASQYFGYNEVSDTNINISNIVIAHISGTVPNNGILVKRSTTEEQTLADTGRFKYFSADTNTIYPPRILVRINDSIFYTGSNSVLASGINTIYFPNLNAEYNVNDIAQIRVLGREKYPAKSFLPSSSYASSAKQLPSGSFYSIKDLQTEETVIDFDDSTRLSCSGSYSYFNLFMKGLQPERYYRVVVKVKYSNTETAIYDSNNVFKVIR